MTYWKIIEDYFRSDPHFLTIHHIDSYNDFVINKIPKIIAAMNPIIMLKNPDEGDRQHEVKIWVGGPDGTKIFITKPTLVSNFEEGHQTQKILYPNEARLKDLTYQSDLSCTIHVTYTTSDVKGTMKTPEPKPIVFENVKIGAIPIMLHSRLCPLNGQPPDVCREMGECPYDQGGYFIVDGKEKVIVAQERIATNRVFISKSKDAKYSYEALIRCTSAENPLFPKTVYFHVLDDVKQPRKRRSSEEDGESEEDRSDKESSSDEESDDKKREAKEKKQEGAITVMVPNINCKIPICILFRALGIESDRDIVRYVALDERRQENIDMVDFLSNSIVFNSNNQRIQTQEEAIAYLSTFVKYRNADEVRHILINDLFPNMTYNFNNKALFLGYAVNNLIRVCLGVSDETDRDSYIHKRVDISGFLLGKLFRDYYNEFRNDIRNSLDKEYFYGTEKNAKILSNLVKKSNLGTIFKHTIIEDGLKRSLKGTWGVSMINESQDFDLIKEGIVQDLSRISYLGTISHLRRVNTPLDATAKIVAPHRLHSTQWGVMCPCESPDGGSIGLLKNMAILCHVTSENSFDKVKSLIRGFNKHADMTSRVTWIIDTQPHMIYKMTKVMINSNWIGICASPAQLVRFLKLCKRNAILNIFTSIAWNVLQNELNIMTEAGRCCRPLFVVQHKHLLIAKRKDTFDWRNFVSNAERDVDVFAGGLSLEGVMQKLSSTQSPIEYVDVEEANCALIAMREEDITSHTSYCELHPSTMFSVVTQTIPLANHNAAARNIFSGAQGKQAIGWYASNFNNRIDTMSYMLHYPQKCFVTTRYMEHMNMNKMPNGENLIVAFCSYTGYNQEDAILMNKSSVERGMFNLTYYKSIIEREEVIINDKDKRDTETIKFDNALRLANEGKIQKLRFGNYNTLDESGLPIIDTHIQEGDAIIGKCSHRRQETGDTLFMENITETYKDVTLLADKTVSGTVDKVFVYQNSDDMMSCKVLLRKVKLPELGDKCCSKHAQKGVIGMIIPSQDMPYTKDGLVPDIIINPHGIPTRMTIGHLLECILGKCGAIYGTTVDGTPFCDQDFTSTYDALEDKGFNRYGDEVLYNGMTGVQLKSDIFIGPTYYERLKHMSGEKINYRSQGPLTVMTRQPTQGRGNGGGLRIGEMEMDALWSHGAMAFLKESMMERSDNYSINLDTKSHFITDNAGLDITNIRIPYSMKQLLHELTAMGIKPNLHREPFNDTEAHN